jgi:hypothetical protein
VLHTQLHVQAREPAAHRFERTKHLLGFKDGLCLQTIRKSKGKQQVYPKGENTKDVNAVQTQEHEAIPSKHSTALTIAQKLSNEVRSPSRGCSNSSSKPVICEANPENKRTAGNQQETTKAADNSTSQTQTES